MSQIFEPYVESLIKTSNDTDRAGYSNHRLVVAAVLISDYGDSGIKLISNQKELLTMYRPSDKQYLHKDLDSSFFHIYAMLANSAVLVNKVDAVVGDGLTPNGLSFQNLFGAKTTVDYKGVIGVADNNKSYLLDGQDRLVDTYASVNVGPVSIQSLSYLSMVASLYNYDSVTKIGSVQVYGYKYNDDNDLILHLVYHYVDGVNEFIKTSLGLSSIPSSLPTAKSFTPDNNFNILAKSINPDGATITNSGSRDLRFMIINSSPNDEIINFKFNDQIGTDNLTLGFLTTNKTSQSVRLSPESSTLAVGANMVKLTGDPLTDPKVLKTSSSIIYSFVDPFKTLFQGAGEVITSDPGNRSALFQRALLEFLDYDGGYRIDFIWDSGEADVAIQSVINSIVSVDETTIDAEQGIKALGLHSVDTNRFSSIDSTISYYSQSNHTFSYKIAPFTEYNFGVKTIGISSCVDYIEAISRNKNSNSEFAPVFGLNNGSVTSGKLMSTFNKSQRVKLLAGKINTIKSNQFRGATWINDCKTGESANNLFTEEWIVRLANRVGWDLDFLLEQFIGRYDVQSTAEEVRTTIKYYMNTNIMSQNYKPESYDVIVNSSNNVWGDGELNVEVDIYVGKSLRKITVVSKTLPLSQI
jgi:hypothetical protein